MAISNPHYHRQNRRRERPGSRTRHITRSRVLSSKDEFQEAILDARDSSLILPVFKPSPLLRQNFDQSWQRWKARQAEEEAAAEMDKMQLEQYLYGGELDDDALYRTGVLYDEDDTAQEDPINSVALDVPAQRPAPFVIRSSKRSKRKPRAAWLPLNLSLSDLSHDPDLAPWLSSSTSHAPTIHDLSLISQIDISHSTHKLARLLDDTILISPQHDPNFEDWTFIDATPSTPLSSSESETWLMGDGL